MSRRQRIPLPFPPMLKRLHALAQEEAKRSQCDPINAFAPAGLMLYDYFDQFELGDSSGWAAPTNIATFACAGSDRVEYSLMQIDGRVTDDSPVVMTAPLTQDNPTMIVGANLTDFLCLGCRIGYGALDELTFALPGALEDLLNPELVFSVTYGERWMADPDYRERARLLELLTTEFQLSAWRQPREHLMDLQAQFMARLETAGGL